MAKPPLTQASGITADLVLQLGKFYSSNELRSVQSRLTGTAREIRNLAGGNTLQGRLGEQLSLEQQQLLRDTAQLIESVNTNIEHAKERKKRSEDAKAAWRKQRDKEAHALSQQAFPLPDETLDQKLEIIKLTLVLHRLRTYLGFYSAAELHQKLRQEVTDFSKLVGWTIPKWKLYQLTCHRRDMLQEIQAAITSELDERSVQEQLAKLQQRIADIRDQVLADPLAVETVRVWADALSSAADREGNA